MEQSREVSKNGQIPSPLLSSGNNNPKTLIMKISNVPVYLSLLIIIVFGVVPTIAYFTFGFTMLSEYEKRYEAEEVDRLKQRMMAEMQATMKMLDHAKSVEETRLERSLSLALDRAHHMAQSLYQHQSKNLSIEDLESVIRSVFQDIRLLDGKGFVFAFSMDGVQQVYPPDPTLEGTNWLDRHDGAGKSFFRQAIDLVRTEGDGFIKDSWPFPDRTEPDMSKIFYLRLFEPLGWVMGIGGDTRAVEKQVLSNYTQFLKYYSTEKLTGFVLDRRGVLQAPAFDAVDPRSTLKVLQDIRSMDQNDLLRTGGFLRYDLMNSENDPITVFLYAKKFAPWDVTLGLTADFGRYTERMFREMEQYREDMKQEFFFAVLVLVAAVMFVFLLGRLFSKWLKRHLGEFEYFFKRAGRESEQINIEGIRFTELKAIGEMANHMVAQRVEHQKAIEAANAELVDANRRLEALVNVDGLTGVANRRHLDHILEKEWARALREQTPLTLGILDVDQFKLYNDTYGHQQGDECLKSIAGVLRESTRRPADLAARYGGEEFAILLPNTSVVGGEMIGNTAQEALASLHIPHSETPLGRVSFSMGISSKIPAPDSSLEDLIHEADLALYSAKENGRNRIEVYSS